MAEVNQEVCEVKHMAIDRTLQRHEGDYDRLFDDVVDLGKLHAQQAEILKQVLSLVEAQGKDIEAIKNVPVQRYNLARSTVVNALITIGISAIIGCMINK